ncbi:RhoGAP-domain-containing protein [Obba rivulosa]|uniref:RhoGAP-domain-containing protein n=1 Tax=Obba rivulosa TaxID=1052685 RepID=A0A8E2AXM5_9APHY|nr:RhoGAP-domain-containing protein [Obba rivulosa]
MSTPNGTPVRDRTHRADHSSSPSSALRTISSSSNNRNAGPSAEPITAEALLAAHATAPDPALAALDAVVSERNGLAVQNTQLWKLIEKQRSGYAQLVKELERVRGERDVFRSRLNSLGESTDALLRARKEKEKREGREKDTLRSTASHANLRGGENGGPLGNNNTANHDPRGQPTRAYSDDIARPNGILQSNSHETLFQSQLERKRQDSPSSPSGASSQRSQSAMRSPPTASSSLRPSLDSPWEDLQLAPSSTSLAPVNDEVDPVLGPWDPIHVHRRDPNIDSNIPDGITVPSDATAPSAVVLIPPTPLQATANVDGDKPTSIPLTNSGGSGLKAGDFVPPTERSSSPSSQGLSKETRPQPQAQPFLPPSTTIQSSLSPVPVPSGSQSAPLPNTLSPNLVPGLSSSHVLSRESRVSLPEEAKRYYASMSDSPFASPAVGTFAPGIGPSPPVSGSGSPVKAQIQNQMPRIIESPPPAEAGAQVQDTTQTRPRASPDGSEFLDLDADEDNASTYDDESGAISGAVSTTEDGDGEDGKSSQAVVEEFPIPPGMPGYANTGTGTTQALSQLSPAQAPPTPTTPFPIDAPPPQATFRALPLLAADLPHTSINVVTSTIRPNDRGKEVLSFVVAIDPGHGKSGWRVEKLYSDVLSLDARIRTSVGRSLGKKMASLPEGKMWRDHAPARVDQRKNALELYLRSLIALPVKNKDEIIAFLTSDIVREASKPVSQAGYKEGYLTKRGKNFGGWKSRYFVLQGPSLEYYESRGGTHLGSITITGAQIGRQQRNSERREGVDEDNEYRHAFLIIEAKKGPTGSSSRHVLCAETDEERDSWVEELVRYVTGTYSEEPVGMVQNGASPLTVNTQVQSQSQGQPRSSSSSNPPSEAFSTPVRRTREIAKGAAVPISKLAPDATNAKLFQSTLAYPEELASSSPAKSVPTATSPIDQALAAELLSSSLPTSSPLVGEDSDSLAPITQRANSEMGHYADLDSRGPLVSKQGGMSPEQQRKRAKRMSVNPLKATAIPERTPSPEKDSALNTPRVDAHGKVKISGPMNGTPIPAGYKFGGKDAPPAESSASASDRREKAKSRTFWNFGRQHDKAAMPAIVPRAVFGVTLEESLDVAQIATLPAIVFRCIQYLEAKQAELEEGIYRLSGSSAVIKSLKDRFNAEGDVDILASDEYWDPHAIAGLLKTFLRELPASILTRELHLRFLSVIDFVDPQERIMELSHLIASLPIANYSLLRALTAHLILIVQNANINKMTMRNVGIVFSPTLGIPAGVFSLMLGEFKRVFNVDGTLEEVGQSAAEETAADGMDLNRRNSKHYSDAAADQMLGLTGRALPVATAEEQSDEGEEVSVVDESGTEGTSENDSDPVESSATSSTAYVPQGASQSDHSQPLDPSQGDLSPAPRSRAAHLAASRGLNVTTDKTNRRQSRMVVGLPNPNSPRPSPRSTMLGQSSTTEGTSSPAAPVSPFDSQ